MVSPGEVESGPNMLAHTLAVKAKVADFFLRPPTLTASNIEALLSKDSIFTSLKDLNLLKKYTKYQETSYNFSLGFALSNRPHFNSVYLVRVPFLTGIAV